MSFLIISAIYLSDDLLVVVKEKYNIKNIIINEIGT